MAVRRFCAVIYLFCSTGIFSCCIAGILFSLFSLISSGVGLVVFKIAVGRLCRFTSVRNLFGFHIFRNIHINREFVLPGNDPAVLRYLFRFRIISESYDCSVFFIHNIYPLCGRRSLAAASFHLPFQNLRQYSLNAKQQRVSCSCILRQVP